MAIFQHHDGITGTATPEVVQDYGKMLFTALHDMEVRQGHWRGRALKAVGLGPDGGGVEEVLLSLL